MSINSDLMYAILSMDSYNQGYDPGIDHGASQVGTAKVTTDSTEKLKEPDGNTPDIEVGFYGALYDDENLGTVISFRGTNFEPGAERTKDIVYGWASGGGDFRALQVSLATEFLKTVSSSNASGVSLTRHSLGEL